MDAMRGALPYANPATFLSLPYRAAAESGDFGGLDVGVVGVPFDLGVTNRPGTRFGPRAVRAVDRVGPFEPVLRLAPLVGHKLADVGDVQFSSRYSLQQSHEDIEAFFNKIVHAGVIPLAVGGDHSMTYPILRAIGQRRPVSLIHVDAHCDTSGPLEGSRFHHGGPFRQAVLDGVLDPEKTIQIGIRGSGLMHSEFSQESGMTVVFAEDIARLGVPAIIDKARSVVGTEPTYVSFDIDSLDPAFAPGTGTPEIGGLASWQAQAILRRLRGIAFVGMDVVEVAPAYDVAEIAALAAATVAWEYLALLGAEPAPHAEST